MGEGFPSIKVVRRTDRALTITAGEFQTARRAPLSKMQDTKERAAIATLQWASRQTDNGANENARVLLAVSNLTGTGSNSYDVARLAGVSANACNLSISQLKRGGYIESVNLVTQAGLAQIKKILTPKP